MYSGVIGTSLSYLGNFELARVPDLFDVAPVANVDDPFHDSNMFSTINPVW